MLICLGDCGKVIYSPLSGFAFVQYRRPPGNARTIEDVKVTKKDYPKRLRYFSKRNLHAAQINRVLLRRHKSIKALKWWSTQFSDVQISRKRGKLDQFCCPKHQIEFTFSAADTNCLCDPMLTECCPNCHVVLFSNPDINFLFTFLWCLKKKKKKRIFIARSIYLFIRFLWLSNIMFYILQNDCRANTIWPVLQNHYYCITLVLICYKVRIQFQSINNWNNKFFVEGWVWNTLEMCYDERWEYIPLSFY